MESKSLWGDLDLEVEALLKDPALLYRVKCELDRFIVGEDKNKLLLFLICASSYTKFPLSAIITGESSSGKSWLMNNVLRFFDNVEEYTRITPSAPDRLGVDFTNRILKVEELKGSEQAQATLRVWISEGKLRLLTTSTDTREAEVIETLGVPTFITTCSEVNVDTELLNRVFFLSIDESREQTRKILEFEAKEYGILGIENEKDIDPIFKRMFQPLMFIDKVIIPYADILAKHFPIPEGKEFEVKPRRDFKKLLYLIGVVAWIHQMQRIIVQEEIVPKSRYVVASPVDFLIAWRICEEGIKSTLLNLSLRHKTVLEAFNEGLELTAREVSEKTGYSQNRARELLNGLVRLGYLYRREEEKPYKYGLKRKVEISSTIDKIIEEINSTYEEKLKALLNGIHENTKNNEGLHKEKEILKFVKIQNPKESWIYVDPITGEQHDLSIQNFVFPCIKSKEAPGSKIEINKKEDANKPFVHDLKSVFWVEGAFGFHECGICGSSKLTSWKAETFKNEQFWICEDCKEKWERSIRE